MKKQVSFVLFLIWFSITCLKKKNNLSKDAVYFNTRQALKWNQTAEVT